MSQTYLELQDAVLFNSFSATRYRTLVSGYLNDAVLDVCRRLELFPVQAVVTYDAEGVADTTTDRIFRVDQVFLADGPASSDVQDVRRQVRYELQNLGHGRSAGSLGRVGYNGSSPDGDPLSFRAIPAATSTGLYARVELYPVAGTGFVAISGLQRPAAMSADSDTSGLGGELDGALIAYARMRAFQVEDDMQMAGAWLQEYERALRTASQPVFQGPHVIPGDDLLM